MTLVLANSELISELLQQMRFWQHTLVEDADNFNDTVTSYPVEDVMACLRILSVAWAEILARLPQIRIFTQQVEALVELKDVVVSLLPAPSTLGVQRN